MKVNASLVSLFLVCMVALPSCSGGSKADTKMEIAAEVMTTEVVDSIVEVPNEDVEDDSLEDLDFRQGIEQFGHDFFSELLKFEKKNLVYSPMSLSMTMGMLANGTSGNTRTEILKAIGCPVKDLPELNSVNKSLRYNLPRKDKETKVSIANSLWYNKRLVLMVNPEFRQVIEADYGGEITPVNNFASQEAIDLINAWSKRSTHGFIPKLFDSPLSSEVSMLVANALYFKGDWSSWFFEEGTRKRTFYNASGMTTEVDMMSQIWTVPYFSNKSYSAISMPYGDGYFSMIVVLPARDKSLEDVYSTVKMSDFLRVAKKSCVDVNIFLPKFSITYNSGLKAILQKFGVKKIFTPGADMSAAFPVEGMCVDALAQIARIEVNESGTEASAETCVTSILLCMDEEEEEKKIIDFIVDRPFLFMIAARDTGVPLFIGAVRELGN